MGVPQKKPLIIGIDMSKKKRNKSKYTINQFIDIICSSCKHCAKQGIKKAKADFCYTIFKSNPWGFCGKTLPRIKQIEKCTLDFESIFCKECELQYDYGCDPITQTCKNFFLCIEAFKTQTGLIAIKANDLRTSTYKQLSKSIKPIKKKEPYRIKVAYPTMFHGTTDPEWVEFIKEVVEEAQTNDAYNTGEQNNNSGVAGKT